MSQTSVSVAWAHVSVSGTQATPRSFAAPSAPKRETATLQQTVTVDITFFFFFHNGAKTQIITVLDTDRALVIRLTQPCTECANIHLPV